MTERILAGDPLVILVAILLFSCVVGLLLAGVLRGVDALRRRREQRETEQLAAEALERDRRTRDRLRAREEFRAELRAAYAELLESYKDDRVDWPEVLSAQHDYFDARLTQVDNRVEARTQEVLIYGYLLHDGLMAAPGATPPGHIDAVPKPR